MFVAGGICVMALVVIASNLPSALRAGANRTATATTAAHVRVVSSESHRLTANIAILEELRRTRSHKNAVLARSLRGEAAG
jgi:hypothetical protein